MTTIEHVNITVPDINDALEFLQLVAPDFSIRKDAISELGYRWVHIGNNDSYIALQEPHPGFAASPPHETYRNLGVNHIGIVVEDARAIESMLLDKGYRANGDMMVDTHRRRIYFFDRGGFEWEMVEYTSDNPSERYLYE